MRLGGALFLIALGAILKWAVTVDNTKGFNVNTAGVILMIVGAIGLLCSMLFWSSFSPYGSRGRDEVIVRDREVI